MDFSFSEDQLAIADLAGKILSDHADPARLRRTEESSPGWDTEAWQALAAAGLLGASLPESAGGSGGGLVEACLVLEQEGKRAILVPFLSTIVAAAMPIARFGSAAQRERWLPGVVRGETLLTAALAEQGAPAEAPATRATRVGAGFRLDGTKIAVPYADASAAMLVPARLEGGDVGVFVVERSARGLSMERQETTNWVPSAHVALAGVEVGADALLGAPGAEVLSWIVDRTTAGLCALASGACREAMRITAEYASNRKQFDKPIAMFQAVGQRMAECYIDNEAVHLTMWQAATRLHDEMPSSREVATAKYWASEAGSFIGHAALHIHGGISIDVDYPVHRYFLWLKAIEATLGAATPQLVRLGGLIAAGA